MALFVLAVIGVVVAETWSDWRREKDNWALPEWVKGAALGGVLAVSLAAISTFATALIQDPGSEWQSAFESRLIWPEGGLLIVITAVIIVMTRKRKLPVMLLAAGVLFGALWLGLALIS